jgi:hypothetical protein
MFWMKNILSGAGYRMFRMKLFGGLIELDVLDENIMAGNGMILDESNGWA